MVANCWAIGSSSFEATKACLRRAVCATRDARLATRGARLAPLGVLLAPLGVLLDGCVGSRFVVGPFVAAGVAVLDCTVLDPEVFAAGVAVDCATPNCTTISNPNRTKRRPRRRTGNGEEEPDIFPLYADFHSTVAAGESVA